MSATDKDTIYIDIDDEITGIIDKLKGSSGKVVALVLPKRAAVFQSIVNMKLLKRAADASKKNLVLITSEIGLLPLAGAAGVHVAKTLTSKPEIPLAPLMADDGDEDAVDEDGSETEAATVPPDPSKTVGQLAGGVIAADGVETLVLDDDALSPEAADALPTTAAAKSFDPPKPKKNKKLAIPNFERFRLLLVLGGLLLIVLIGGLIFAMNVLPKATISIKTDATNVDTNVPLDLLTSATVLKPTTNTVPAKLASLPKTYTQQVTTTGQKNNGNKASGSVTMSAQICGSIPDGGPADVPSGTGLSGNGQTYITQEDTSFSLSGPPSHGCLTFHATDNTTIIAQSGGASSNGATSFVVAGRKDVSAAVSSTISGGTDSIVQTVNQNDINAAKAKIVPNESDVKQALMGQLQKQGLYAIAATYVAGTPAVVSSANVGDIANTVTVTETVTYTMFGVHKDDLETLLTSNIKSQIDTSKQSILDDGLDAATFSVDTASATEAKVTMTGRATAGPDLDTADIKSAAAGQKPAAVRDQLRNNPDVTDVDVKLSPFWVSSVPKKTSQITVDIAKPTVTAKASSNDSQP